MLGERVRGGDLAVAAGGWWSDEMSGHGCRQMEAEFVQRYHRHQPSENQCSSTLVKHIKTPIHLVWSLVRRFDQPQKYKPFVSRCMAQGDLEIGSVREVNVKSGLPATTSTERLELLDDNEHILSIKIVGGNHRLRVCLIITSLTLDTGTGEHLPDNQKDSKNEGKTCGAISSDIYSHKSGPGECEVLDKFKEDLMEDDQSQLCIFFSCKVLPEQSNLELCELKGSVENKENTAPSNKFGGEVVHKPAISGNLSGQHASLQLELNLPLLTFTQSIRNIKLAKYGEWFNDCTSEIRNCCDQALQMLYKYYGCKEPSDVLP